MKPIAYLKLQAKNLFKDYKTRTPYIDEQDGETYYKYDPQFFDIDGLFLAYDWDENDFSLMKAQHLITLMAGFNKWADLINASEAEQKLAKHLFDNQDKIELIEWQLYIINVERENNIKLNAEGKLEIFEQVFLSDVHISMYDDYRIRKRTS